MDKNIELKKAELAIHMAFKKNMGQVCLLGIPLLLFMTQFEKIEYLYITAYSLFFYALTISSMLRKVKKTLRELE